jgi:NADH-quinone oxidoreductase subunit N
VAVYPEIFLLVMACVIALVDLVVKSPCVAPPTPDVADPGRGGLAAGSNASSGQTISGFGGMVVSDPMGNWLKCFAAMAMMVTLVYGRPTRRPRHAARRRTVHPVAVACWACS